MRNVARETLLLVRNEDGLNIEENEIYEMYKNIVKERMGGVEERILKTKIAYG